MIKRHKPLVYSIIVVSMLLGVLGYRYVKNKNVVYSQEMMSPKLMNNSVNFMNFEDELRLNDGEYYLWFCATDDPNCKYIESEYLTPMLKKLQVSEFSDLRKIDFTDCPFSVEKLKSKFNVTNKLSFTKAVVKNGNIEYSNALSWDDEKPFTAKELQKWLYENNVWQQTYKNLKSND